MKILENENEKKSFAITVVLFLLLFLFLILVNLNVTAKTEELGGGGGGEIAINFRNSDLGSGENYKSKEVSNPVAKAVPVEAENQLEKIVTQENVDAPVIAKNAKTPKETTQKPIVNEKPKPSKLTTDALSSILNETNKAGDGTDKASGNKGKLNGDSNAKSYESGGGSGTGIGGGTGSGNGLGNGSGYGSGSGSGTGSGTGWRLSGRKLSNSGKVQQKCNEYGTVVLQISVNRDGEVINAKYTKGTTNTNPCLIEPAIATAKKYKWQSDANAPETQIGYITVHFKASE